MGQNVKSILLLTKTARSVWKMSAFCVLLAVAAPAVAQLDSTPTPTPNIPGDPLQSIAHSAGAPPGTLAYLAQVPIQGPPQREPFHLVLQQVNPASSNLLSRSAYKITPSFANVVFDPQFSPDGKYVLLKAGWPYERMGTYRFYLWDRERQSLKPGPSDILRYRQLYWSPDSRFIAYIKGGDQNGNSWAYTEPFQLYIYDIKQGVSHFVADNPGVKQLGWTWQNTLLFEASPSKLPSAGTTASRPGMDSPPPATSSEDVSLEDMKRPYLYEAPAEGGKPLVVLRNAYDPQVFGFATSLMPLPSPNGEWIAVYAWPDHSPSQNGSAAVGDTGSQPPAVGAEGNIPGFCLYNRATKKQFLVEPVHADEKRYWRWTPDSKDLISVVIRYTKAADGKGLGSAHIQVYNVQARQTKNLPVLEIEDVEATLHPVERPLLLPLQVTADGRFLLIESYWYTAIRPTTMPGRTEVTVLASVQAVSLKDGSATALFTLKNPDGMNWLDESGGPVSAEFKTDAN